MMKQNNNRQKWLQIAVKAAVILLGNVIYAAAVVLFIMPNGLVTGGTTGLGLFFNRLCGIPVSLFVSVFNIAVFGLGLWQLGKGFALTTVLSTVMYPAVLGIMERTGITGFYMQDRLMAVIYAGIFIGAGIGMVIKVGASTGCVDIPCLIQRKKCGINVSLSLYVLDCVILGLQLITSGTEEVLYGILLIITYTLVLDKVLMAGTARIQVKIVSRRYQRINALIGERLDCGTSLLHMETGYLHNQQDMIMAVISKRDLPRLNQLVLDEDPEAFMVINQINEVQGRGFTLKKVYQENDITNKT